MTSWTCASGGAFDRVGDHLRDGSGLQERRRVVLAVLVGRTRSPASASRSGRGAPTSPAATGSSARSESANPRSANLLAEYDANPRETLIPDAGVDEHDVAAGAAQRGQQRQRKGNRANDIDRHAWPATPRPSTPRPGPDTRRPALWISTSSSTIGSTAAAIAVEIAEIDRPRGGAELLGDLVEARRRPAGQEQGVGGRQRGGDAPIRGRRTAPVIIAVGMSPPYRPASPADPTHHGTDVPTTISLQRSSRPAPPTCCAATTWA